MDDTVSPCWVLAIRLSAKKARVAAAVLILTCSWKERRLSSQTPSHLTTGDGEIVPDGSITECDTSGGLVRCWKWMSSVFGPSNDKALVSDHRIASLAIVERRLLFVSSLVPLTTIATSSM